MTLATHPYPEFLQEFNKMIAVMNDENDAWHTVDTKQTGVEEQDRTKPRRLLGEPGIRPKEKDGP